MCTGLLSPTHIAIVLVALLLIVGDKRLPETGRALGRASEFKQAITGHDASAQAPGLASTGRHRDATNVPSG